MTGNTLRVGIANYNELPLVYYKNCFINLGNISQLLLGSPSCKRLPGISVEIVLLILQSLGVADFEFVTAEGFGHTASNRSLLDLVANHRADFTVPQLAISLDRYRMVPFSSATVLMTGNCFLMCNSPHFLQTSPWGIIRKLLGKRNVSVWLIFLTFVALFLFRLIERTERSLKVALELFVNTVVSRPRERTFAGVFHARVVTTLIVLVFLKGFFKAGLIKTFSPTRRFPFRTTSELADGIRNGPYKLALSSFTTIGTEYVETFEEMAEVRAALLEKPVVYAQNWNWDFAADPDIVFLHSAVASTEFMIAHRLTHDCMCSKLDTKDYAYDGGVAAWDPILLDRISRVFWRLHETGIVRRFRKLYRMPSSGAEDTEQINQRGLGKPKKVFIQVSFRVLEYTLYAYTIALALAVVVLLCEIASVFV